MRMCTPLVRERQRVRTPRTALASIGPVRSGRLPRKEENRGSNPRCSTNWRVALRGRQAVPKTATRTSRCRVRLLRSPSDTHPKVIEVTVSLPTRRERVQFSPGALCRGSSSGQRHLPVKQTPSGFERSNRSLGTFSRSSNGYGPRLRTWRATAHWGFDSLPRDFLSRSATDSHPPSEGGTVLVRFQLGRLRVSELESRRPHKPESPVQFRVPAMYAHRWTRS